MNMQEIDEGLLMQSSPNLEEENALNDLGFFDSFAEVPDAKEPSNSLEWNCGYVNAVYAAVDYAMDFHRNLFTLSEQALLQLLQAKLSPDSKRIFCRLLFRKHKWMKSSSFTYYLHSKPYYTFEERQSLQYILNDVLQELFDYKFIEKIHTSLSFEESWDIAKQLFTYEDWLMFYKHLFSVSASKILNSTSSSSGTGYSINNKNDFIEAMKKAIITQKTVFGASLADKFPALFVKYLQTVWVNKMNSNDQQAQRNNLSEGQQGAKNHSHPMKMKDPTLSIVQMRTTILHFMKRVLRLYQITSNFPSLTTGSTFISIYRSIDNYSPLLKMFKMITYPDFPISIVTENHQSILFRSIQQFLQWEAAVEIRVLLEEVEIIQQEKRRIRRAEICNMKERLLSLIDNFQSDQRSSSSANLFSDKISTHSVVASIYAYCFQPFLERVDLEEVLEDPVQESLVIGELLGLMQYWICLTGMLCYLTLLSSCSEKNDVSQDFLIRYHAETSFTYIALVLAEVYERQRKYLLANLIYELLLILPYIQHRRGRWYKRLCINYDHLKMTNGLLSSIVRGILDINIMYSDEIDLRDRATNCRKKLLNQSLHKIKAPANSKKLNTKRKSGIKKARSVEQVDEEYDEHENQVEKSNEKFLAEDKTGKENNLNQSLKNEPKPDDSDEKNFLASYNIVNYTQFVDSSNLREDSLPVSTIVAILLRAIMKDLAFHAVEKVSTPQIPLTTTERIFEVSVPVFSSNDKNSAYEEWSCQTCTYFNKKKVFPSLKSLICDMCESPHTITQSSYCSSKFKQENKSVEVIDLIDSDDEIHAKDSSITVERSDPPKITSQVLPNSNTLTDISNLINTPAEEIITADAEKNGFLSSIEFYSWNVHTILQSLSISTAVVPFQHSKDFSDETTQNLSNLLLSELPIKQKDDNNLLSDCLGFFFPLTDASRSGNPEVNAASLLVTKLKSFYLHGQRFGDPKNRKKGKSQFCGINEQLLSVEEFVMQKCLIVDHDEFEVEESSAIDHFSDIDLLVMENTDTPPKRSTKKRKSSSGNSVNSSEKKQKKNGHTTEMSKTMRRIKTLEEEADELLYERGDEFQISSETTNIDEDTKDLRATKSMKNQEVFLEMKNFETIKYEEIVQKDGGWDGWHCEGSIVRTLFGILMFPIFYSSQDNVFLTPYQDGPLDFPYPSFFLLRRELIEERVKFLYNCSQKELLQELAIVYEQYHGCLCSCVSWDSFSLLALQISALSIGSHTLAVLCYAMSKNYKQLSSGAPDLFLLRVKRRKSTADGVIVPQPDRWYEKGSQYEVVPLEFFFGDVWKEDGRRRRSMQVASNGSDNTMFGDVATSNSRNTIRRSTSGANRSKSSSKNDDSWLLSTDPIAPRASKKKDLEVVGGTNESGLKRWATSSSNASSQHRGESSVIELLEEDAQNETDQVDGMQRSDKGFSATALRQRALLEIISEEELNNDYFFEGMFVEVKGPGDHLAYKQLFWQQLLSMTAIHSIRSYVGHVKERKSRKAEEVSAVDTPINELIEIMEE